jgi:hypothetical protein
MRTFHRTLCAVGLVFVLTAACGDDEKATPTTNPVTPTTAASGATPSTTVPATTAQRVTDGAICPTANARGTLQDGRPMVCTSIAGGNELRWRPA